MDTSIARRSDGKLIRAKKGIDTSLPFFCPGCKQEVYAVVQEKVQKAHFRHKSAKNSKGCTQPESYIHWITKELFADNYNQVTSFYISLNVVKKCIRAKDNLCEKKEEVKIDLKKIYPYIKIEQKTNKFIPDCLLFNDNGDQLFFEVCYSNPVSEDKIKSGFPIIELEIKNEKVIDDIIEQNELKINSNIYTIKQRPFKITLHNKSKFLAYIDTSFDCFGKCIADLARSKQYKPKQINHSNMIYEVVEKTIPFKQPEAIAYLSKYANNIYDKNHTVPEVLGKCKKYYIEQYNKYKQVKEQKVPIILDEQDIRFFVIYKDRFFSVLKYESYWHIYYYEDKYDQLVFIDSKKNKDEVLDEIKKCIEIF